MPGPEYSEALPLYERPGTQLHVDPSGRAQVQQVTGATSPHTSASLSGSAPHYGSNAGQRGGMGRSNPVAKEAAPKARKPTNDELMAMAMKMEEQMKAQHAAQLAAGPAVKPVDQGAPPWLQDYMALQPKTDPYAPIPPPAQMSPEQRQMYGADRPAWLTGGKASQ